MGRVERFSSGPDHAHGDVGHLARCALEVRQLFRHRSRTAERFSQCVFADQRGEFRSIGLGQVPYPFRWFLAQAERHASVDSAPRLGFRAGTTGKALCGAEVSAAEGDEAWLWPTCPSCAEEVRPIVQRHNAVLPLPEVCPRGG